MWPFKKKPSPVYETYVIKDEEAVLIKHLFDTFRDNEKLRYSNRHDIWKAVVRFVPEIKGREDEFGICFRKLTVAITNDRRKWD